MSQEDDPHSLRVPLFSAFDSIGFGEHGNIRHFDTGTLFWSLQRLFGCYERIMSAVDLPYEEQTYLDADLEHFIVRFRIVLNDLSFAVRQLLPANARGLPSPSGPTHPRNREMSISALLKYIEAHGVDHPELTSAFVSAKSWINRMKNDRDNVVHYKSKALIFDNDPISFALINAAGTERTEPTADGGHRLVLIPLADFVDDQMKALHKFMHAELAAAVGAHAKRVGLRMLAAGWNHRIRCIGVFRFRLRNGIEA